MARCLSVVVKVLLVGGVLLSVGWALSETRPPRHVRVEPRKSEPPLEQPAELPAELPIAAPIFHAPRLPPPISAAPAEKKPAIAHVSGRIVDENGNPRSDAKADIDLGDVCIWIHTDSTGHFAADLAPGEYTITAVDDANGEATSDPLSLKAGEEVRDLVLELRTPPREEENRYDD